MDDDWSGLCGRVRRTVGELVASGAETGVQVSAYLHGEPVIDVYAGDAHPGRPATPDTLFPSFSTAKGVTATVVHVLAERGALDYDLRIADVWPEYAAHGKQDTTLGHALTHATGVPHLPAGTSPADFADWHRMCALIADAVPRWEPGTRQGYHAWTYGWIVGETVRRATGRTLARVLAEEVAGPLGVADELFFGVPERVLDRVARLGEHGWQPALSYLSANLPHFDLVCPPAVRPDAALGNRPEILRADVPAIGTFSARALARMYAALLGEVDGVRLISPERLARVSAVAMDGPDWVFGQPVRRSLGYAVEDGYFGASGSGGSLSYAFPQLGLTVAATKNRMSFGDGDPLEQLRELIQTEVAAAKGS
ncbi:serine hydrolase domain-containing protein [Catellatospora sp. KI3]|uniref:serine hydrolase domain-containing protein n=1 Tax=Catellatospora sp. KI3 TaxID=3041620 RepID=UPI002482C7D9|nr:serine hydrolase domain-containing protein [Catellatospora sp. KI3]MDI1465868.1 serine hydrolase domain-containing protein [Catellatospora sp. KI3]